MKYSMFKIISYARDLQIGEPIFIDDDKGGKHGIVREIVSVKWADCDRVEIRGIATLITKEEYKKELEKMYNEKN
ncbi:hypothetical protein CON48_12285 [Bacillus thuringiensis]|uniref:Uncharacterized protein n=1 Tax=Bacillus thuringiensis TaxID=1428 RepID=A0A9X6XQ63_BACTU|nr:MULTISPECIES: hypothetical protein [Bacillus]MEC2946004.1 hypothetical protein [Bacillus cereus]MEC3175730.1 hypothetical protein [Bacillus cereus]PDY72523.1 hypothetical protein COM88_01845 [Bacillus cereus]PDY97602.1 hypothetical protein CON12_24175 [Bacillus thuringiensis]PEA50040.1 hypothetical protein CON48_12285 [Bacillus thuringiensis]